MLDVLEVILMIADKVLKAVAPKRVLSQNSRFQLPDLLIDGHQHVHHLQPHHPGILHHPVQQLVLLPILLVCPRLQAPLEDCS